MKKFTELSEVERTSMFDEKLNKTFLINRSDLNFDNIENEISGVEVGKRFILPPILLDKETYFNSILFSSQDNKGRWLRTMLRTYMEGGNVVFKKLDDTNFEVQIIFQK